MFKKILVPVDGSSTSWRALETAKDLAVKYDGELIVAHIVQTYSSADLYINSLDQTAVAAENDQLTRIGSSVLDTARTKMEGFTARSTISWMWAMPRTGLLNSARTNMQMPSSSEAVACPASLNFSWAASAPAWRSTPLSLSLS